MTTNDGVARCQRNRRRASRPGSDQLRVLSGPIEGRLHPNPYIKLLLSGLDEVAAVQTFTWRRAVFGRYDILHLHWPEHLLNNSRTGGRSWGKVAALAVIIARAKVLRTKLVWTVHNEMPHEQPRFSIHVGFWLWQRFADAAVFLTESGRTSYSFRPPPTSVVIRHGHYGPSIWEDGDEGNDGRPPGRPYLLSFGLVRRYKGFDRLIQAAAASRCDFDVVIAGPDRDSGYLDEVRALSGSTGRVAIDARYVPQPELVALIRQSSGVVLPYHRMNNSGALLMSLTLGKRVLVPDSPSNREIGELVGPGWITYLGATLEPRDLDAFFVSAVAASRTDPSAAPRLDAFEWDDIVGAHEALYRKLVG